MRRPVGRRKRPLKKKKVSSKEQVQEAPQDPHSKMDGLEGWHAVFETSARAPAHVQERNAKNKKDKGKVKGKTEKNGNKEKGVSAEDKVKNKGKEKDLTLQDSYTRWCNATRFFCDSSL